jgi:hypothetical protein
MLLTKLVDTIDLAWKDVEAVQRAAADGANCAAGGCICVALDGCQPGVLQSVRPNGAVAQFVVYQLEMDGGASQPLEL